MQPTGRPPTHPPAAAAAAAAHPAAPARARSRMSRKQKIAYFYDPEYTGFYYGGCCWRATEELGWRVPQEGGCRGIPRRARAPVEPGKPLLPSAAGSSPPSWRAHLSKVARPLQSTHTTPAKPLSPSPDLPSASLPLPEPLPLSWPACRVHPLMSAGADHPMKPMRMVMAHHLILGYGLHKHLDVYVSGGWLLLLLLLVLHRATAAAAAAAAVAAAAAAAAPAAAVPRQGAPGDHSARRCLGDAVAPDTCSGRGGHSGVSCPPTTQRSTCPPSEMAPPRSR